MHRHSEPRSSLFGLLIALLAVSAFGLGVMAERWELMPRSRTQAPANLGRTFDPFWESWNLVQEHYVDRDKVNHENMTRGAVAGMLASLGDVGHTEYLSREEYQKMLADLDGAQLVGIGVRLGVRHRRPTITAVLTNSPAKAAGVKPGDVFLAVNGEDVSEFTLDRIAQKVRGDEGQEVKIRLHREGEPKPLDFAITRAKIEMPDVTWHMLPGSPPLMHIAIQSFGKHANDLVQKAVKEARAKGARGLVVDLRSNPGGLREQAIAVTSQFLTDGNVFLEQDAKGNRTLVPVIKGGVATDLPLFVLIDEGTASSAEIFAGAIQDHGRGKLIGARTFGTGTVLQPFELRSDGSAVLLAIHQWLTPKGRQIWHKGITPDIEVMLPDGIGPLLPEASGDLDAAAVSQSEDIQLLRAIEELRKQLR